MFSPHDEKVVFFDTEFSSLDWKRGELLSVGLVKMSGEELYLELEFEGVVDQWPRENILPHLRGPKVSKVEAAKSIENFIGGDRPYVVAYVNSFDMIYLYGLLGLEEYNRICQWIPIDFASILFSRGIDPEVLVERPQEFFEKLGIDLSSYVQHNARDDAKLLREVYRKLRGDKK